MIRLAGWHVLTSEGPLAELDAMLPAPNSLRRASEDSKAAVATASKVLAEVPKEARGRVGVYVGQQRGSLEYCTSFIDSTYRDGPRLASPLFFSESVANNAATHLSLTLGFTGVMATFIGSRVAGLQALIAAQEDLEAEVTDAGLVVVQSFPTPLMSDAYHSVYLPHRRHRPPPPLRTSRGSISLLLRPGDGAGPRLLFAGLRCFGRSADDQARALRSLWEEFRGAHAGPVRVLLSTFTLVRERAAASVREVLGGSMPTPIDAPESFALDPFLQALHPSPAPGLTAVACLSEEGLVGLLALQAD